MLDRWGNTIQVSWAAHEIIWLHAAMTLPPLERHDAYRDIAGLSGRSLDAIRRKAGEIRAARKRAQEAATAAIPKPTPLPPSELRGPTRAQLTGGNARVSRRQPLIMAAE